MGWITAVLTALIFFVIGMILGFIRPLEKEAPRRPANYPPPDPEELEKQKREYRNFLSYDGSEQG
ncbi:MAG: hypothetical protein IJT66_01730 [Clostridia bacterium]|nr:hypothetical protein [Clostridia bacterium]